MSYEVQGVQVRLQCFRCGASAWLDLPSRPVALADGVALLSSGRYSVPGCGCSPGRTITFDPAVLVSLVGSGELVAPKGPPVPVVVVRGPAFRYRPSGVGP